MCLRIFRHPLEWEPPDQISARKTVQAVYTLWKKKFYEWIETDIMLISITLSPIGPIRRSRAPHPKGIRTLIILKIRSVIPYKALVLILLWSTK